MVTHIHCLPLPTLQTLTVIVTLVKHSDDVHWNVE